MLPQSYTEIRNGKDIALPFHTDFRPWMQFERLITDARVPEDKVVITALRLVFPGDFPQKFPKDLTRASMFMLWFYRCGRDIDVNAGTQKTILLESRRTYSFEEDFDYIAAAFLEQYRIDLWDIPYMHWWKFHALFNALHDCKFTEICAARAADITSDTPEYKREYLEKMQETYALHVSANELRQIETARKYYAGN